MLSHHVCDEHEWEGGGCDFCNVTVGSVLMVISLAMARSTKPDTNLNVRIIYWLAKLNCIIEVNRQNGLFPRNSVEATRVC